jgi:hypothetical protein
VPSPPMQIADAVAGEISGLSGDIEGVPEFTATRLYAPREDLVKLATEQIQVLMVMHDDKIQLTTRDQTPECYLEDISIDAAVMVKLPAGIDPTTPAGANAANAFLDPLVTLARSIALLFSPGDVMGGAGLLDVSWPVIYDAELLKTGRTFFSLVKFVFKYPSDDQPS